MRPIIVSVGPLAAAVANGIAASQALAAAGPLVLNGTYASGGVATLPQVRRVSIASAGNDSALTWTITGTDGAGCTISETLAGGNAVPVQSALDYRTVTSIRASAAVATTVTAGTSGVAASAWVRLDEEASPQVAVQCTASGVVNYSVQSTLDDPNDPTNPVAPSAVTWVNSSDATAVNASGTIQTNFAYCPRFMRVLLNSGNGSVTTTVIQSGSTDF